MTSLRNIEPKLVVKLQPFGTERVIDISPVVRDSLRLAPITYVVLNFGEVLKQTILSSCS